MRTPFLLGAFAVCGLAASAGAGRLVAVDSNDTIYEIDMTTGAKTAIGTVSSNVGTPAGLARDHATGTVYVTSSSNDSVFTIDLSTGVATLIGSYGSSAIVMHGIEWDSSTNTLYGGSTGHLWEINQSTGAATQVGSTALTSFINLGHDSDTNTLYATNQTADTLHIVDRTTGAMTLVGSLNGPGNPHGLAYDTEQQIMWLVDSSADTLYTINLATGAAIPVGSTGSGNLLGLVFIPDVPSVTSYCHGDGSGTACPCGNAGAAGNGCAHSLNANGANLAASGSASISADTLVLTGSGMPNSSALYFQGTVQVGGGNGAVFGDGLRCVAGTVARLGTKTNAGGTSQYPDVGDVSISVKGMNAAGNVRDYQSWYRNADPAFCTASTFNLTNGVELTWQP